jgi:formamidopyrimidine-DNA glycosylase
MPELPEVETIRQGLSKKVINKKITKVEVKKPNLVRNKQASFKALLNNNNILNIDRIGKLLIFVLNNNSFLLIHLKMTGQLIYSSGKDLIAGGHNFPPVDNLPNKYSYIIFSFIDGSFLYFNDMRQFGYMEIVDENNLEKIKKKYGIEPGQKDFTLKNFRAIMKGRRGVLKAFLLNQQFIAGIGNIYADEICFRTKIKPNRTVDSLSDSEIKKLYQASQYIIKKAIDKKGTTFSDYRDASNKKGGFKKYLKVYGRQNQKCLVCKKVNIKKIKLAGRGTHFCPNCQPTSRKALRADAL